MGRIFSKLGPRKKPPPPASCLAALENCSALRRLPLEVLRVISDYRMGLTMYMSFECGDWSQRAVLAETDRGLLITGAECREVSAQDGKPLRTLPIERLFSRFGEQAAGRIKLAHSHEGVIYTLLTVGSRFAELQVTERFTHYHGMFSQYFASQCMVVSTSSESPIIIFARQNGIEYVDPKGVSIKALDAFANGPIVAMCVDHKRSLLYVCTSETIIVATVQGYVIKQNVFSASPPILSVTVNEVTGDVYILKKNGVILVPDPSSGHNHSFFLSFDDQPLLAPVSIAYSHRSSCLCVLGGAMGRVFCYKLD